VVPGGIRREDSNMATKQDKTKRARQAVDRFDQTTRPVVRQIVDLAQQGVAQASAALQVAGTNIDKIADAAVDVATTQIDLATPPGTTASPKRAKRS
jgi:ectoine hydroxylase-related dioxygenase (phytanoyl-CoA dioxygenase family)